MSEKATDFSNGLIDVTSLNLADLDRVDDSRLSQALRRLLDTEETGPVAGFQSAI
ncbi:FxSxx-COOH cyclophane-containing RiPP peptide [Streptosporangium sp. NPDC000239]|uniref:FxSxx-COOH cyclophane-containing RiPP peptide n=1 Tax=Streptosporangium jomthongense TaxID=1193683 RepID=A0ABV8FCE4_9ACTN